MSSARLQLLLRPQGNLRGLLEAGVTPAGVPLSHVELPVLVHGFRRMVRELAYDVSEMAATTYLCARAHGVPFTALPVFPVRGLHHGAIHVRRGSGIVPSDLEGKRVGVQRGYTVTTGVWARDVLAREHGVDLDAVQWVCSGDEHVTAYQAPPNVERAPEGADLQAMLLADELAATIGVAPTHPDVVPLLPADAGQQALARDGRYPINHLVVVRDDLLASMPGLAADLFDAFARSKAAYVTSLLAEAEPSDPIDRLHLEVHRLTGADPLPYGIEPNRQALEALISAAHDQHIITEVPQLEDLFAEGTREAAA